MLQKIYGGVINKTCHSVWVSDFKMEGKTLCMIYLAVHQLQGLIQTWEK